MTTDPDVIVLPVADHGRVEEAHGVDLEEGRARGRPGAWPKAWKAVRARAWLGRWVGLPILAGAILAANVDLTAPPLLGTERLSAVFLADGQGYVGHLEDVAWSDVITLRDVYYFQDARSSTTNLPLALVKRGGEVHGPADGLRIRRERVLAVERVGPTSPVARAITSQRGLEPPRQP